MIGTLDKVQQKRLDKRSNTNIELYWMLKKMGKLYIFILTQLLIERDFV
jgi:hypothetical protein